MTMLSPCLLVYRAHLGNPDFFEILRGKLPDQLHDMWNQTFPENKSYIFYWTSGKYYFDSRTELDIQKKYFWINSTMSNYPHV